MHICTRILIAASLIVWSYHHLPASRAQSPPTFDGHSDAPTTCDSQLAKYRTFMLQSILSFGDICDGHGIRYTAGSNREGNYHAALLNNFQPSVEHSEMWAFFKLLLDQFNDAEFSRILRDTVNEHCRLLSRQMQLDEKRNSVVLGKKQRFHSWGGKRSSLSNGGVVSDTAANDYGEEYANKRLYLL